ncbi:hypothetical protein C8035_v004721 [Colletotrichum spinosum]|uniref:Uncharacterized protein n=1 Tax=Colletotrichum spinosum TaxID=1347390 RepID=A0A4R8QHZ5_9PEZI|nr:hypothetical protein C8035_v004721 [Colletotrichum spinosum]
MSSFTTSAAVSNSINTNNNQYPRPLGTMETSCGLSTPGSSVDDEIQDTIVVAGPVYPMAARKSPPASHACALVTGTVAGETTDSVYSSTESGYSSIESESSSTDSDDSTMHNTTATTGTDSAPRTYTGNLKTYTPENPCPLYRTRKDPVTGELKIKPVRLTGYRDENGRTKIRIYKPPAHMVETMDGPLA